MKRYANHWPRVTSFPNLVRAAHKASRGKHSQANVAQFMFDLENQLCRLQDELVNKTYAPGTYRTFMIREPKPRMISAAPFRDRVVHHALCFWLEQIFEPTFISDSYACRRFKGTHAAVDRFQQMARRHKYVLKSDISKFFPSIDHVILKQLIARKIKDRDVLWLAERIIDASNLQESPLHWFPGDDLFTPAERRRGLPIGNQTSQFFANLFLNPLDHFVKEELRAKCYVRYVDDFVILSDDKDWLNDVRERCRRYLQTLRLALHPHKSVVSRVADGTRFLGFRVFPNYRLLTRDNPIRMRRRLRQMQREYSAGTTSAPEIRQRLESWIGHAMHADTFGLRTRLLCGTTFSRRE